MIQGKAYAKINLYLHIVGRYSTGYHELDMIMSLVDAYDEMVIKKSEHTNLHVYGDYAPILNKDSDNLVLKALSLLEAYTKDSLPCSIDLIKNIPSGAGLGGGSSDAALTLNIVRDLYQINISDEELATLALQLGADVPFFLKGQCAHVTGVGENISSLHIPALDHVYVLLVYPARGVSTRDIFKSYAHASCDFSKKEEWDKGLLSEGYFLDNLKSLKNDLEPIASEFLPAIEDVLYMLSQDSKAFLTRMSGSGSCCFSLYDDYEACQEQARVIKTLHPSFWVHAGSFVRSAQ